MKMRKEFAMKPSMGTITNLQRRKGVKRLKYLRKIVISNIATGLK